MRFSLSAICIGSFVIYAIAIKRFFTRPARSPGALQWLSAFGLLGSLVHIWLVTSANLDHVSSSVGLFLYSAGIGLFLWSAWTTRRHRLPIAFSQAVPSQLIVRGPFRLFAHPFYTAYSLTWLAGIVVSQSLLSAVVALPMFVLYSTAARQERRQLEAAGLRRQRV